MLRQAQYFCRHCQRYTMHARDLQPMGCGDLFMVILTAGFWILIRIAMTALLNPFRCQQCGRRK